MLTLACSQWSPWLPLRLQTDVSTTVGPFCLRNTFRAPADTKYVFEEAAVTAAARASISTCLTDVFAVHVVVEGETVGGAVTVGGGALCI